MRDKMLRQQRIEKKKKEQRSKFSENLNQVLLNDVSAAQAKPKESNKDAFAKTRENVEKILKDKREGDDN